jgi:hypothetical protein
MFKVGDLVRRHQIGEPEQMFMFDVRNLGVVVDIDSGKAPGIHVYWQLSKRSSYYSLHAAENILVLVSKAQHD